MVNYDTHGDGGGQKISYEKGRGVADQTGTLTAAFMGNHGWFWRNRTDTPLTVTVRTRGRLRRDAEAVNLIARSRSLRGRFLACAKAGNFGRSSVLASNAAVYALTAHPHALSQKRRF